MSETALMVASDTLHGSLASCYVTIGENRYNFMNLTEFTSTWEMSISDVPILGKVAVGHKATGGKGTWSGKAHYNQSQLRKLALEYQQTGVLPYFEIQVTNEDKTSTVGKQTIVHVGCLCDKLVLATFAAGEETLEEELSGTFDSWEMPESFTDLPGI